jgi:hypothetical protein
MYLIRDTFACKPGKAKDLVRIFKETRTIMEEHEYKNVRILTDIVSNYWTVVLEVEVESLQDFENRRGFTSRPEVREIMKDYMTLVTGGKREIFNVE